MTNLFYFIGPIFIRREVSKLVAEVILCLMLKTNNQACPDNFVNFEVIKSILL